MPQDNLQDSAKTWDSSWKPYAKGKWLKREPRNLDLEMSVPAGRAQKRNTRFSEALYKAAERRQSTTRSQSIKISQSIKVKESVNQHQVNKKSRRRKQHRGKPTRSKIAMSRRSEYGHQRASSGERNQDRSSESARRAIIESTLRRATSASTGVSSWRHRDQ